MKVSLTLQTLYTTDEESWRNEMEIYHSEMFTHENVLRQSFLIIFKVVLYRR